MRNIEKNKPNDKVDVSLQQPQKKRLFKRETFNETVNRASKTPPAKRIYGNLWREGQICILFSDTNLGKTTLATQIGVSAATGNSLHGLEMEITNNPYVLYFDYEMSDKQIEARSCELDTNTQKPKAVYKYPDELLRVTIDESSILDSIERTSLSEVLQGIEEEIKDSKAKIVIIDNMSFIAGEVEKYQEATKFMKGLKRLNKRLGTSMLVLAHTPKKESLRKIIINDLAGSKALGNFVDSAFSIGFTAKGGGQRYVKQLKDRDDEIKYGEDNVIHYEIKKIGGLNQFVYKGLTKESSLIIKRTPEQEEVFEKFKDHYEDQKGKVNQTQCAIKFKVSRVSINRWCKELSYLAVLNSW